MVERDISILMKTLVVNKLDDVESADEDETI